MSLRDLAKKHLEQQSRLCCPVSGHLGASGPDKTVQPDISLGVPLVRTPDTIRTSLHAPDSLSGSDSVKPSDKPDASDNSDNPDRPAAAVKTCSVASRHFGDSNAAWWNAPVEGWPHRLTIRNLSTGKETVIDLRRAPTAGRA